MRLGFLFPLALSLSACGGGGGSDSTTNAQPQAESLTPVESLGEKIFHDTNLSKPARQSCATCHDEGHAFASATDLAVPPGVRPGSTGFRNAPSLVYGFLAPEFSIGDDGPVGGFFRDGRATSLADQAREPFLTSFEMANDSIEEVIEKVRSAPYAQDFRKVWGAAALDDANTAYDRLVASIAAYEKTAEFHPFTSKYDYFLAGKASLTNQELRGFALFNNAQKGNCAACHPSTKGSDGSPPMFTDFTYDNLGVPRNFDIAANSDPTYYDLGPCGPFRTDITDKTVCGAFKVPTLRNIALTAPYMHNGYFKTLEDVVNFYVTRDTDPLRWYPVDQKFNDLPVQYQANVNTTEVPYNRKLGDTPALSPQEILDVVAFLKTLSDGYQITN
jgi:cytochrome c peroxidase